jgi:hypothetical protein
MAATTALREALNQGISTGNLVDTKIVVYSRRNSYGQVCRPKPLYTSSHVLKTVPYFNDRKFTPTPDFIRAESHTTISEVLFGNFAEAQPRGLKEAIRGEETTEDYGYLSDSDLEDDEDMKTRPVVRPFDQFMTSRKERRSPSEENEEGIGEGKIVKIPDVAFVT